MRAPTGTLFFIQVTDSCIAAVGCNSTREHNRGENIFQISSEIFLNLFIFELYEKI